MIQLFLQFFGDESSRGDWAILEELMSRAGVIAGQKRKKPHEGALL
ncbi:hypothetical protein [Rhizobium sp. WL3]|nr:hypothetical protein [Rhizobium sp. WL3]